MSTGKPESFSANESVRELRSNFALFLALGLVVGLTAFGLNSLRVGNDSDEILQNVP